MATNKIQTGIRFDPELLYKITYVAKDNKRSLNAQLEYLTQEEQAGRITIIAPDDTLPIGRTQQSGKRMKIVYQMGRDAAMKAFSL